MKLAKTWFALLLAGAVWLAAGRAARAQVTLTVSPAVTSNTYPGFITLNITGVTNTEQVIILRWLDVNGDGLIEPGEPLLEVFRINESGAMVINGVTNVSVPYDTNPATNSITTTVNFGPPLALMDITAQQIFTVVSPTGRFTPVGATLLVTNAALAQSVNGTVYSNGIAALPHALVVALTLPNQNYAGATLADSSGRFHLTLPTGQYGLLGLLPGYYVDQNLAPMFTLTNGVNLTNNLVATNSSGPVISGYIYDAATTNPLAGVGLQLSESGGSLFTVAFTDTNGFYSASVTSNNWKIKLEGTELAHRAYIIPENSSPAINASLGSVSNVNLGLLKANALYYGKFYDAAGVPLVNYVMEANDNLSQFKANGFTDAQGNYGVAVVNSTNSPWYVGPASDNSGLQNYIYNSQQMAISYSNNLAFNNFYLLPITGEISGRLTDNQGNPLANISVGGYAIIGTNSYNTAFIDTDTNGFYSVGAASGTWNVFANQSGGDSLATAGYYDPANHFVTIPPTNAVVNLVVYPASDPQLGQAVRVGGSQFNFNIYGASGENYTLQMSTNLINWQTVDIISNLPGSPYLIEDYWATNRAGFFRVFQGP